MPYDEGFYRDLAEWFLRVSELDKVAMIWDGGFLQGVDEQVLVSAQRTAAHDANVDIRVGASPALGAGAKEKYRVFVGRKYAQYNGARHVEMPVHCGPCCPLRSRLNLSAWRIRRLLGYVRRAHASGRI